MANTSHSSSGLDGINQYNSFVKAFEKIPDVSKATIKNYFEKSGIRNSIEANIKSEIPMSVVKNKKYKGVDREHARSGDSIKVIAGSLGFLVTNEKYYQYLVFPNLGLGTSKKHTAKNFVKRGIEENVSRIESDLTKQLEKELQKVVDN